MSGHAGLRSRDHLFGGPKDVFKAGAIHAANPMHSIAAAVGRASVKTPPAQLTDPKKKKRRTPRSIDAFKKVPFSSNPFR